MDHCNDLSGKKFCSPFGKFDFLLKSEILLCPILPVKYLDSRELQGPQKFAASLGPRPSLTFGAKARPTGACFYVLSWP